MKSLTSLEGFDELHADNNQGGRFQELLKESVDAQALLMVVSTKNIEEHLFDALYNSCESCEIILERELKMSNKSQEGFTNFCSIDLK